MTRLRLPGCLLGGCVHLGNNPLHNSADYQKNNQYIEKGFQDGKKRSALQQAAENGERTREQHDNR